MNTANATALSPVELTRKLGVADLHHDITYDIISRRQRGESDIFRRVWLPRFREIGTRFQAFPIWIDTSYLPELGLRRALAMTEFLLQEIEQNSGEITLVRNVTELDAALQQNKIAAVLALEGCDIIEEELTTLRIFHRLGLRFASLTWNRRTIFADGTAEVDSSSGLSAAGVRLVAEMENRGIIVDVSHLSDASFWSVLKHARKPVIASHSNARSLCNHPRNLTDDQIRAVAETGGIVGVLAHPAVIDPENPVVGRVADHVEHMVNLIGIDRVGLGVDFVKLAGLEAADGPAWLLQPGQALMLIRGFSETAEVPNLSAELLRRGYSADDIGKILSGNVLAAFRRIWQA